MATTDRAIFDALVEYGILGKNALLTHFDISVGTGMLAEARLTLLVNREIGDAIQRWTSGGETKEQH